MKKLFSVLLVAALPAGIVISNAVAEAPKGVVVPDQLEERNEVHYFEGVPYTGVAVKKYRGGRNWQEFTYKDGKKDGSWTRWYKNGRMRSKRTYKDGKLDGPLTVWLENGQKLSEVTWKDGKKISEKEWDEDGNPLAIAQKSMVQKPVTAAEASKVVVDSSQLEERDDLMYLKEVPFTGVVVDKYGNGQKLWEVTFKDGKEHGLVTEWYENGQKESEWAYKDGKRDGLQAEWYENGQKEVEGAHKDGNPVTAIVWKPNGEKCPDTNLVNGNGIVCEYWNNGQKEVENTYKDGKKDGLVTEWHVNGQKEREGAYKDGKPYGPHIMWYENGQKSSEVTRKDGKKISEKYWDDDGNPLAIAQESTAHKPGTAVDAPQVVVDGGGGQLRVRRDGFAYFKGVPFTGVSVGKYKSGRMRSKRTYKDGKLDGLRTRWHENGKQEDESNYKDGKQHGLHTWWHLNGRKQGEITYEDGKLEGLANEWHDNGRKRAKGAYRDGHSEGLLTEWDENGQKRRERTYKDGKLINAVVWKPNGEKCPQTDVVNGNGVVVYYKEDGTESRRVTYKDGVMRAEEERTRTVELAKIIAEAMAIDYENLRWRSEGGVELNTVYYKVARGDTLWGIARKNNVSLNALVGATPGLNKNASLYIGQRILVPTLGSIPTSVPVVSPGATSYVVKKGDNLTPYTGWVKWMYDNGQIKALWQVKDGKRDGLLISYNKAGTESSRTTYKDGERVSN
jgi:antitoxin component YwqK of YwqJK toxin-antitoxin module